MYANDPSQLELQEVFEIVDGKIWRREYVSKDGRKIPRKLVENVANHSNGYCTVWFKGRRVYYHRTIWVLVNGSIPAGFMIDHRDGNKVNSNINNLRLITNRENQQNMHKHREDGALPGVSWHRKTSKWKAQIKVEGKGIFLGYFDSQFAAFDAYIRANEERGYPVVILLELRDSWLQKQVSKYRLTTWTQANENFAKKILDI